MVDVVLPARITGQDIVSVAMRLGAANRFQSVTVDFTEVRFFEAQPMCFLLGKLIGWINQEKAVKLVVPDNCRVRPYMQRMDFFKQCGVPMPEAFTRQNSASRFREFTRIERGAGHDRVSNLSSSAADCVAPGQKGEWDSHKTGLYDAVEYSVSEMLLNTIQHARGPGFLCAQYYPTSKNTQLALADVGLGIRQSFEIIDSPHTERINTDVDAVKLAIEGQVSCTSHRFPPGHGENPNSGVGLTVLTEITKEVGGNFVILSGEGAVVNGHEIDLGDGCGYQGTYCAFTLPRHNLTEFLRVREVVLSKVVDEDVDEFAEVFE